MLPMALLGPACVLPPLLFAIAPLSSLQNGIDGITGAEVADGCDECIKAVRRQIGAGADWIKANYRVRSRMSGVSAEIGRASMNTFDEGELRAMVECAHRYGVKVATHAMEGETIEWLVALGVDSIEHGYDILSRSTDAERTDAHADQSSSKTIWVPTLAAYYTLSQGSSEQGGPWACASGAFKAALEEGMENIACGDTGAFAHGQNAPEMVLMVRLGADWRQVLRWGTLWGWAGRDFEGAVSAENIRFVMKAGRV
ncbi:hypothetical protein OG21DRAFT_1597060 [Imleria badia]|nr:hypothetical protein OG21DRAFT_1597060 [Imleria badia]